MSLYANRVRSHHFELINQPASQLTIYELVCECMIHISCLAEAELVFQLAAVCHSKYVCLRFLLFFFCSRFIFKSFQLIHSSFDNANELAAIICKRAKEIRAIRICHSSKHRAHYISIQCYACAAGWLENNEPLYRGNEKLKMILFSSSSSSLLQIVIIKSIEN